MRISKSILLPILALLFLGSAPLSAQEMTQRNLVEVAAEDAELSTLVAAVRAAKLEQALSDTEGKITLFAPTNAAFGALPEGVLEIGRAHV